MTFLSDPSNFYYGQVAYLPVKRNEWKMNLFVAKSLNALKQVSFSIIIYCYTTVFSI